MARGRTANRSVDAFWSEAVESLLARLGSTREGLSAAEAAARLRQQGPNALKPPSRFAPLRLLARQFESPLVAILVFAAVVAAIVRDWTDAAIVLVILLGSGLLGFAQEYRASAAVERLRARVRAKASVLQRSRARRRPHRRGRDRRRRLLSAGSLIPADGIVLEARDLFLGQAALTGEAFPAEKRPGTSAPDASLAERSNCVFMGTSVHSGTGTMLVVRTGAATAYGEIADRLRLRPPETEFFSPTPPRPSARMGRLPSPPVKNGEDAVDIAIRDTGCGIPEANLPKIFDPFFTTKPPGQGTGLGLSICHGIILRLGGQIAVESQVGQGTEFTITLPRRRESELLAHA